MRRTAVAVAASLIAAFGTAAAAGPAQAAPANARPNAHHACATKWGKAAKHAGKMVTTKVRRVRAGEHACFDRVVVDLGVGAAPGYRVRYVRQFHQDASGKLVRTKGRAKLLINVEAPAAASFKSNSRHLANVAGFHEFRQIVGLGSFEGVTSIGLGMRARNAFRVLEFRTGKHRFVLVVDVAS